MNKEEQKLLDWLLQYQQNEQFKSKSTNEKFDRTTGYKYHFYFDIQRIGDYLKMNVTNAANGLIKQGYINMFNIYLYKFKRYSTAWCINSSHIEKTKDYTIYNKINDDMQNEKTNETDEYKTNAIVKVTDNCNDEKMNTNMLQTTSDLYSIKVQINKELEEVKYKINGNIYGVIHYSTQEIYDKLVECLKNLFSNLDNIKDWKDFAKIFRNSSSDMLWNLQHDFWYRQFVLNTWGILYANNLISNE